MEVRRERDEREYVLSPTEAKAKEERSSKSTVKRREFGTLSKVKLNYCIVPIDANDVRIIMIILTIGNSPILSIRLIRLGQLRNDLSISISFFLSGCLSVYLSLSIYY